MDSFHERLARIALDDLFTTMAAVQDFPAAQAAIAEALRTDGLNVTVEREGATFARLVVSEPASGTASTLELGVDWRAYPPVLLAIGPVLHPLDAVANKVCALFGRAAVRDYIDVHGVLKDGRFSGPELLQAQPNMIRDSIARYSRRPSEPSPAFPQLLLSHTS